jgi:membrane-bound ClpP family serine protease
VEVLMDIWVWAFLLLLVGLCLAILEMFVPSGGILGFLSACAFIGAIVLGFRHSVTYGIVLLVVTLVGVPIIIAGGLALWPHTPMGRRILLDVPTSEQVLPEDPRKKALQALVGQVGVAKTKMLPSGVILINGRQIDAISDGTPIEPGEQVRVLQVRANRVVVRPLKAETQPQEPNDLLQRPIDSVLDEPFESDA